jgi:hypothetical protein
MSNSSKAKLAKQLLPGISAKSLKPVATLVEPQELVVPMVITGAMAQVADNLKGSVTSKEIQQLDSVKTYSKCLGTGASRLLSATHAMANTLGPEAAKLATLSPEGRMEHLADVKHTINTVPGPAKVKTSALVFQNEDELSAHRRGLALQCRSNMQSTPIYNKTQMTLGLSIRELTLDKSIESAKQLWINIGRDPNDFDSQLLAQVPGAETVPEAVISIVKSNLAIIMTENQDGKLIHGGDNQVLKGEDNLTPIERNLGCIERLQPILPEAVEVTSDVTQDPLLQAALSQQKQVITAVTTSLQKAGKAPKKTEKEQPTSQEKAKEIKTPPGQRSRRSPNKSKT